MIRGCSSASRTSSSTSAPTSACRSASRDRLRITQEQIDALEADCDRFNADLPELKSFVLPGGSELAARLHVARATCRRAERDVLDAAERVEINPLVPST